MIQLNAVNKYFGKFQALKDINLDIIAKEVIVICGPSGSGKSTLIRCINGLERRYSGTIKSQAKIGMCFQHFNLFPHLTVLQNCTLALMTVHKLSKLRSEELAREYLARVKILDQQYKYPAQLSGGQQQRLAIARSLTIDPKIMLFDEPTSALDPEMIREVLEIITELASEGMTIVCVTHEMGFARAIADRIIFMDQGEIIEQAAPEQFFANPQTQRAKLFLSNIMVAADLKI
jgi:general L-amino acid transport system ATP-binding protein